MFQIIILNLLLTLPILALAQEPVPRVDGDCPVGYTRSGDFCKPLSTNQTTDRDVIEKRGSNCPTGYRRSGSGHCKQSWGSDQTAIPKAGKDCPVGYSSSGKYCKPINAAKPDQHHAIERVGSDCPPGFTRSGDYCKRLWNSDAEALPRKDDANCPRGYRTRGNYCVEI